MFKPLFQSIYNFPNPEQADPEHHELICMGGDLDVNTLLHAYSIGLFPWFNEGDPIAWYSPSPRCVIYPEHYHPSKSLLREMKKSPYYITVNQHFTDVLEGCAAARNYTNETWINSDIKHAYTQLHHLGYAISIEVLHQHQLIGGLYGLKLGQAFFGESMFHTQTNASKMAFFALVQLCKTAQFKWIDCQFVNDHLLSLGAVTLDRHEFLKQLPIQIRLPYSDWTTLYQQKMPICDLIDSTTLQNHDNILYFVEKSS